MFSRLLKASRKLYVPLGWTIFTQVLLSIPGKLLEGSGLFHVPHLDKVAHIGLFGGLAFFWSAFFYYRNGAMNRNTSLALLLVLSLYGVGVEFFQFYFIPNRSFDVGDIVADICGALCGFLATIWILRITANR